MVVPIVVAVAVVVVLVPETGFSPNENPATTAVAAGAVVAVEAAGAEMVAGVAAPRGLSIKDRLPAAADVVVAAVLTDKFGIAPKVKPGPVVLAADVEIGEAKRVGPGAGADCVKAGGAGVDEGLIPKANPVPCPVAAGTVAGVGWGCVLPRVRLEGALVPKLKPPPVAAVGAAAVVT